MSKICPVCDKEFEPVLRQVYCSDSCNWRAAYARKQGKQIKREPRFCERCGASIDHRASNAVYCEQCTQAHDRCDKPRREPNRETARHTAKVAMERLANKASSQAAAKQRGGYKPLSAGIMARIDRIVERAKANGTCYGA